MTSTYNYAEKHVRGIVVHDDGSFAVALHGFDSNKQEFSRTLWLSKRSADNEELWTVDLNPECCVPKFDVEGTEVGGCRLRYGDGKYICYFTAYGTVRFGGHHGDRLVYVGSDGEILNGGWEWGCSHSIGQLVSYNPILNDFLALCVSDAFPAVGISAENSSNRMVYNSGGSPNGLVSAMLGQVAHGENGWKLLFNAIERPCCEAHGIGFVNINSDSTSDEVKWLTVDEDASDLRDPVIARIINGETNGESYVVGWRTASKPRFYTLAVVDGNGNFQWGPTAFPSEEVFWGRMDDPMRTNQSGTVGWIAGGQNSEILRYYSVTYE